MPSRVPTRSQPGLKDESEPAGSVETRDHVIQETMREYVEFASLDKFPDCKRDRGNERDYYQRRQNRTAS